MRATGPHCSDLTIYPDAMGEGGGRGGAGLVFCGRLWGTVTVAPAACRSRFRCFRRASFTSGNPRATASRITAETDTPAASASASSAAAVAGSTVTRNCFE